jgi:hypothetical protein
MKQAEKLPHKYNLHVFKNHIVPLWEDVHNKQGGKWIIKCPRDHTTVSDLWREVLVAAIGQNLSPQDLCGCVLVGRRHRTEIHIWVNRPPQNLKSAAQTSWFKIMKKRCPSVHIKYQTHSDVVHKRYSASVRKSGKWAPKPKQAPVAQPKVSPPSSPVESPKKSGQHSVKNLNAITSMIVVRSPFKNEETPAATEIKYRALVPCRYGQECTRYECHFNHFQTRLRRSSFARTG